MSMKFLAWNIYQVETKLSLAPEITLLKYGTLRVVIASKLFLLIQNGLGR